MTNPHLYTTTICLVRHGETDWNASGRLQGRENVSMNSAGREQVRLAGAYLKQTPWDVLVSSPLARARESAEIVAAAIGTTTIRFEDALMEIDVGESSGLLRSEVASRWPDGNVPGRESLEALAFRATRAIQSLADEYANRRVLAITHGAFIRAFFDDISNGEYGGDGALLANACVGIVHYRQGQWDVESYNSVAYLKNSQTRYSP
jgi:uncharacterized phosphatase